MDTIRHVVLESPLQLLALAVLIEAVLATCWWFRPGRITSWAVVVGLLLAAVLLIVQHLVVTDRERIDQILEDLALAVDCEDIETLAAALDDGYRADDMDKDRFLERVADAFERADIDEVKIVDKQISVEGDGAVVHLRAHGRIRSPDWPYEYNMSSWEVRFIRRDGDWWVIEVRRGREHGVKATDLLDLVTR